MIVNRSMVRLAASCAALWLLHLTAAARAQAGDPAPVRVALFKTANTLSELSQLASALDPVLQTEIGRVSAVSIAAVPPLDLPSLQLALDCVGETQSCLDAALRRSKVDALLSPALARSEGALVVSLLRYDPQQSSPLQVASRRLASDAQDARVFEAAAQLVRELFPTPAAPAEPELPATEPVVPPSAPEPAVEAPAAPPPSAARLNTDPHAGPDSKAAPSLLLPLALGAAGVSALAIGIGFGVASNASEDRYAHTSIANEANAQVASDRLGSARAQSTVANIALGLGAAACVAAGVVFVVQRTRTAHPDAAPHARLRVGPGWLSYMGDF